MGERNILTEEMIDKKLEEFAKRAIMKTPREYMTFKEFQEKIADWSKSTLVRRINEEGFPAVRDGGSFLIPRSEIGEWFRKRKVQR